MEIDQDYLRTGTAVSSRASREHELKFLVALGGYYIVLMHSASKCY